MQIERDTLTPETYQTLIASVGWRVPPLAQCAQALAHSTAVFSAVEDGRVVGIGRLTGDRALTYYIKDLVVDPAWQGKGVGRALLTRMIESVRADLQPGWGVSIELMASVTAVGFYKSFGFEPRPNEARGPGMALWTEREAIKNPHDF